MKNTVEPYRILFPIGVLFALFGVGIWLRGGAFQDYAIWAGIHSQIMVGAFLFAFAAGFLMTAVPKMTASFPARPFEIWVAAVLVLGNAFFALKGLSEIFFASAFISISFLLAFFFRRFLARTKSPPKFFPFVIMGLFSGLLGSFLLATGWRGDFWPALGKSLYFEGMILFLILGIGSRLIPVISGRGAPVEHGNAVTRNLMLGSLVFLSYGLHAGGIILAAGLLKFSTVFLIAAVNWKLFARINTPSKLAHGMRGSGIMVLAGLLLSGLYPAYAVHWMHLTYIGGFGLMTFTVASRVTLAHGSYDLGIEARSRILWIAGSLILLASLTRVAAPFAGVGYPSHIFYAALTWTVAVSLWAFSFVARMIHKGEEKKPACGTP